MSNDCSKDHAQHIFDFSFKKFDYKEVVALQSADGFFSEAIKSYVQEFGPENDSGGKFTAFSNEIIWTIIGIKVL